MTPANIIFTRKIRLVFDKLRPNKKKVEPTVQKNGNTFYEVCEKDFYGRYQTGKRKWEVGTIVQTNCRMIHLMKQTKMMHKMQLIQIKK